MRIQDTIFHFFKPMLGDTVLITLFSLVFSLTKIDFYVAFYRNGRRICFQLTPGYHHTGILIIIINIHFLFLTIYFLTKKIACYPPLVVLIIINKHFIFLKILFPTTEIIILSSPSLLLINQY